MTMMPKHINTKILLRIIIVIASFSSIYFSTIGLRCLSLGGEEEELMHAKHLQLQQRRDKHQRRPVSEIYILSLLESKANIFRHRNFFDWDIIGLEEKEEEDSSDNRNKDGDNTAAITAATTTSIDWFPSYDGMNQTTLKEWSQITGLQELNVSDFINMASQQRKDTYASPHVVGCYLSHWRVLEKVWKEWKQKKTKSRRRPDLLFIFEDDAYCVSNVIDRTWNVVRSLPDDWDILYIGGKPMSYYTIGKSLDHYINMEAPTTEAGTWKNDSFRPTNQELLTGMCSGQYGKSISGPFPMYSSAKEASSSLSSSPSPAYYEIKNILNTHAYVVNPKRISRLLRVLSKPLYEYKPVDVILADDMFREFLDPNSILNTTTGTTTNPTTTTISSAPLKAYLAPHMYCDQDAKRVIVNRDDPKLPNWEGYYWLPWRLYKGFPDFSAYVWGTMGTLIDQCTAINN